ncbi:MAG: PfkB family carbohydrate kinase [Candidatus Poseidoniaceae archaeon]|jgi:sugar/nucleoside kinase (ribokinase family)|nr:PfkB family carbohydrate kinase [Candidatus Poseidoniaceae archaeon]MDP7203034.1 PfkB family carbohydrate kinase [Candidatus Poseidoniaceae archaeon]|tara:strand:- start:285 stop:1211 length:927 start_codon:yes stop_codon:yes gene_type:complete
MDVVMIGSLAYDSVESPAGAIVEGLGGSATFAGVSACRLNSFVDGGIDIGVVGVVGKDFLQSDVERLEGHGLDLGGVERSDDLTFRWVARYGDDFGDVETLDTQVNCIIGYSPQVPEDWRSCAVLLLANMAPSLQEAMLEQVDSSALVLADSMEKWIVEEIDGVREVIARTDVLVINETEAESITGHSDIEEAATVLLSSIRGDLVIIKLGAQGATAFFAGESIHVPAVPGCFPADPTGCGDSFIGTLAAHMAINIRAGRAPEHSLRDSMVDATVAASLALEGFSIQAIEAAGQVEYSRRAAAIDSIV